MRRIKNIVRILTVFVITLFALTTIKLNPNAETEFEDLKVGSNTINDVDTGKPFQVPKTYVEKENEFRGVWIATVYNLNMDKFNGNIEAYKNMYRQKLNVAEEYGFNAILFQVRGMNDTYYESDYAPFSSTITGTEGGDPGWDIMEFLIEETHSRGMEFHAWMNPYRVQTANGYNVNSMHDKNFAKQRNDLVIRSSDAYILNPGEPEVRDYIRNVVGELMEKYPTVDGIHFDDYFYYGGNAEDDATYQKYGSGKTLANFRRDSISELIEKLHHDIKQFNEENNARVKFGISPSGIYLNKTNTTPEGSNTQGQQHYHSHFIDTVKWIKEGWLDYITPQIYWQFSHNLAPYGEIVKWWVDVVRGTGVDLIVGHSVSDGTWHKEERAMQVLFNSQFPEIKGSIMYSHANINSPNRIEYIKDNYWVSKIPTNYMVETLERPEITLTGTKLGEIYKTDVLVKINSPELVRYKLGIEGDWQTYTEPFILNHHGDMHLYFEAYNNEGKISPLGAKTIGIYKDNNHHPTFNIEGTLEGISYIDEVIVKIDADPSVTIEYYVMSGVGSVAEFLPYEGELTINSPGKNIVYARTILGNTPSNPKTIEINIKEPIYEPPTINIIGDGHNDNYESAIVEIFTLNPGGAQYKINGGRWQNYSTPIELIDEGEYLIETRNATGNRDIVTKTIYVGMIDSEPTMVDIIIDGEYDSTNDEYTSLVLISFTAPEDNNKIYYRTWVNGKWNIEKEYTEPIEFVESGLNMIEYYVQSKNGEKTDPVEVYFNLEIGYLNFDRVIRNGNPVLKEDGSEIVLPEIYNEKSEEIRAIWFSTVSNIDLPNMSGYNSLNEYKQMLENKFNVMKANKINTVFFQVRPMNDALYYSDFAPYSRYVTGKEGVDPGFDILSLAIELAHERGIELHAWLNPYRVSNGLGTKEQLLNELHDDNFAKQNPNLVLADNDGKLILNPGEPGVHDYLNNVINELVTKYNIDGIHFDDYFYSYAGTPEQNDKESYNQNKLPNETLGDWRRRNVNIAVENTSQIIRGANKELNKNIKFGISPFGIWRNKSTDPSGSYSNGLQSYDSQYADSKKWVEEGWVDYITPQVYWHFDNFGTTGNPIAPFADIVDWWYNLTNDNNVGLIIGQALYRQSPTETSKYSYEYEIVEQMRYLNSLENILGVSFFTYNNLESNQDSLIKTLNHIGGNFWTKTVDFPWISDVDPNQEANSLKYEVIFENGDNSETVLVKKGYQVVMPTNPEKDGYEFIGWYLEDELFDFDTEITKDITLVAKWKEVLSTIIVEFNTGFAGGGTISEEINKNDKIEIPKDPSRKGYKFIGWYLEDELFDFDTIITENITLFAKWEKETSNKATLIVVISVIVVAVGGAGIFITMIAKKRP